MRRIPDFDIVEAKSQCCACGACVQTCGNKAIKMIADDEGFCYPIVDLGACIDCGLCSNICQYINKVEKSKEKQRAFGGQIADPKILSESTSGGAFTAIANEWCDENYVIFGATANGLDVYHKYITDKTELYQFRRSKYSQSKIGNSFIEARNFLNQGKKVLFSGTPCQIAGLKSLLKGVIYDNLLTVEVVCEGVPSPLYIKKLEQTIANSISVLDYRYKDHDRWDFQVMYIKSSEGKIYKRDRWFNPFWSIWLSHLMSRPSCYNCLYTTKERVADITLGDLWGVHIYCPDLYNNNRGASLIVTNTNKGERVVNAIIGTTFFGRELDFETALRYQGPMRRSINLNYKRAEFMNDLRTLDYKSLIKKWAPKPRVKLLISKYIYGTNRQKVKLWKLKQYIKRNKFSL